jgi:adenylate cyclase class 2
MREIEVKARISDQKALLAALKKLGCRFSKSVHQHDFVYVKKVGPIKIYNSNEAFLRIRIKDNKKILFTYKKKGVNDLDSIEHELEIDSKDEMEQALLHMGHKKALEIKKRRMTASHKGLEICIDEVEDLGSFIEVEKLTEEDVNSTAVQEELFSFLESIGVDRKDRVMHGYDILTLQKLDARIALK